MMKNVSEGFRSGLIYHSRDKETKDKAKKKIQLISPSSFNGDKYNFNKNRLSLRIRKKKTDNAIVCQVRRGWPLCLVYVINVLSFPL